MRPHWRGRLHTYAAFATIPLGIWLILSANGVTDKIAVGLYALSLHGVFAISSSYHRLTKTEDSQAFMRKLDHSMIYVLIAGTYTPMWRSSPSAALGTASSSIVPARAWPSVQVHSGREYP